MAPPGSITPRSSASSARRWSLASLSLLVACSVYDETLLAPTRRGAGGGGALAGAVGGSGGSSATAGGTIDGGVGGTAAPTGGRAGSSNGSGGDTSGESGSSAITGGVGAGGARGGGTTGAVGGEPEGGGGSGGEDSSGGVTGGTPSGGTTTGGGGGGANAGSGGANAGSGGAIAGSGGGGGAGKAGSGGGGTSGTGGVAGGSGGSTGGAEVCSGCARLSVPLSLPADQARFTLILASSSDLSNARVTVRVAKLKGTGGTLAVYVQQGGPDFTLLLSTPVAIQSLTTAMQNVVLDVAATSGTINRAAIERVGVQISGTGGSLTNPTVLYVDRIDISNSSVAMSSFTFDTSDSVSTTPSSSGPAGKLWLNSFSEDTTVSGAAISWLGP